MNSSHSEAPPISTQSPPSRTARLRQILSAVCVLFGLLLMVGAVLPTQIWRDAIVGSTTWAVLDDRDLGYMRMVFAGFGLIFLLWSIVFAWNIF
ncbi:MAG: hypothetical protein AAB393_03560, partial [Bacteroidota bacterium]